MALDPDTPLLISSDPDYSSSSEHSCDTVIYVGPGGTAISDRELSDNEGPPSFVPIIPSLNKKRVKDSPRSDGDHLKCNTFAELQERLDCIDGSEGPTTVSTEGKAAQTAAIRSQTESVKPTDTLPRNSYQMFLESTYTKNHHEQFKFPSADGFMDNSERTRADGEKLSATLFQPWVVKPNVNLSQDSEPVVREKVYLSGAVPKSSASPSAPRTARMGSLPGEVVGRTPPAGMSQQPLKQGQAPGSLCMERVPYTDSRPAELNNLRASQLGRWPNRDFMRTTVTLQQPVELNGEDELVFTIIEELPHGIVPDNGHPTNLLSFNSASALQAFTSGSHPVSIISSINDEYDAYTTQQGAMGPASVNQQMFSQRSIGQLSVGSWPTEESADSTESENTPPTNRLYSRNRNVATENAPTLTLPSMSHKQPYLQHGIKSTLNDSGVCFPEPDTDPATPNKHSFIKCPPSTDSTKSSCKGSVKVKVSSHTTSAQILHHTTHPSLPRKTKPTSSGAVGYSRQEGKHDDLLLQGSSHFDFREVEFLSAGKPPRNGMMTVSSKRPGGNSNSVPRPPKAQGLPSAQRVVDGCEKSSGRRGDTLIKLPQLTRGATTLGTVSVPQSSESKWGHEGTSATLGFASLGKKLNGQKNTMVSKSASGNISPPTPPIRQSSQEQKTRTVLSPSALKTSNSSLKPSTSEDEFNIRHRADSFSHKTSGLKTEHCSARTSSSLKTRGAKADHSKYFGSLVSLERCDSQTLAGYKPELLRENIGPASGGKSQCSRSVPRLGVPASTSTSVSSSQVAPGVFATTSKLGQVRGINSSRAAVPGGLKVRTLSGSSSKSLSSALKPPDNATVRNPSLHPTVKAPARSGTGVRTGRGTIMGTKQAISRAVNSRVSELAAGSLRKQISRQLGPTGNDGSDSGTSSITGSPTNTPLPSPYSKITAPRRPQRYSSGHGSDNSSILSGELPPAMGRTALFYHSGGSSGYESMIRDSETTGSTSSAHDSMSESGVSSSNRSRVSKSPKKRSNGELHNHLLK